MVRSERLIVNWLIIIIITIIKPISIAPRCNKLLKLLFLPSVFRQCPLDVCKGIRPVEKHLAPANPNCFSTETSTEHTGLMHNNHCPVEQKSRAYLYMLLMFIRFGATVSTYYGLSEDICKLINITVALYLSVVKVIASLWILHCILSIPFIGE